MYRYYYNTNGDILGTTWYKKTCIAAGIVGSIGYIDDETKYSAGEYHVDLTQDPPVIVPNE